MFLAEVIADRDNLLKRINELKKHLLFMVEVEKYSNLKNELSELFELISNYQTKNIVISNLISGIDVKIGDSDVRMSSVVEIKDCLQLRADVLFELIEKCKNSDSHFDVSEIKELVSNRDGLIDEINKLDKILSHSSWNVTIEQAKVNDEENVGVEDDNKEDDG